MSVLWNNLIFLGAVQDEIWIADGKQLSRNYTQGARVYDSEGIATTVTSQGGGLGGASGLYLVKCMDIELQDDKIIVAMRGRDPSSPTSRKRQTPEHKFEQQLEVQQDGLCNTLSTVQKDNMVLEPITTNGQKKDIANTILSGYERTNMTGFNNDNAVLVGGVGEMKSNGGTQYYQHDRVYDANSIAVAHQAQLAGGSYKYMVENNTQYRIRKLTPKECFRLMGVKDEDYDKLTVSNSQKYKQAGNSIVVDVMMAIFENMFINECESNSLF